MASRHKALSLYKSILRAHEKFLPQSMRQMGDGYVKAEFRLHKSAKPEQTAQFFVEWEKYLAHVEISGRAHQSKDVGLVDDGPKGITAHPADKSGSRDGQNSPSFGKDLPSNSEFNEEQTKQLKKLKEEAAKAREL